MNKYLVILFFITGTLFSQNIDTLKKYALRDAKSICEASIKQDYSTIMKFTHPVIHKKYGEKQLMQLTEDIYKTMAAQKIKIISSVADEVIAIKKEKREYRCLVKNTVIMDFNGRRVTLKSSLFGFYDKKKEHWYFIESNKLLDDPETIELFPNFKTEIDIPIDEQISEN